MSNEVFLQRDIIEFLGKARKIIFIWIATHLYPDGATRNDQMLSPVTLLEFFPASART